MNVLELKMRNTDERLDLLNKQMGCIFSEDKEKIEINDLLQSVNQVKESYHILRKDLLEVQNMQKQLSNSLQIQLRVMQLSFNSLKQKLHLNESANETSEGTIEYDNEIDKN